ncbi:hypothetical protein A4G20_08425 [Pasteurellaceae bacterium RH1A]|nr:hypothetical protein A4G20_08425 [Pasteurellaceae bacterium RH1A]
MSELQLNPPKVSPYAEYIILALLFEHKGQEFWFYQDEENNWRDDDLALALGVPKELFKNNSKEAFQLTIEGLKARYQVYLDNPDLVKVTNERIEQNLQHLAKVLNLSAFEIAILRLAVYIASERTLKDSLNYIKANLKSLAQFLEKIFHFPFREIYLSFKQKGKLASYGLIEKKSYHDDFGDYLEVGDILDIDEFSTLPFNAEMLLQRCVKLASSPHLKFSDFEHIQEMVDLLQIHLEMAALHEKKGVNILIYGEPGTGKTELALLLSQTCYQNTYLLNYEDEDGDLLCAERRLERCRLAQTLLKGQQNGLIFDEIEDVFRAGLFEQSVAQSHKAWVNQFLEENPVPMIWLSNNISSMDNAFLRRFDFIFEMPNLPLAKKEEMIKAKCQGKLSPAYIHHFAQHEGVTPALISKGFEVLNQFESSDFTERTLNWFNQTLQAQGYKKLEKLNEYQAAYNLNWVNCSDNIHKISEGLKATKQGRICCYGPAGTGKTEWARWLASELDMPLLVLRGSDLRDKYVGETEKRIASAFRQASENNMLLVMDEVDSFLFARDNQNRSWENSMVNEMLTQLERFEGLMVVSTNLMDNLDPAVLRRFDLKMKFDFLKPEQVCDIAQEQAVKLGLNLTEFDFMNLAKIKFLTMGDFASLARRHRFRPFELGSEWVKALEEEVGLKRLERRGSKIGFC